MTPGAPSPGGYNPHTPGSGIEQNSSDWVTTDIQVKVRDTYLDTQVVGQTGVIRSVTVSKAPAGGGQASSPLGSPVSVVLVCPGFHCCWLFVFVTVYPHLPVAVYSSRHRCGKVWRAKLHKAGSSAFYAHGPHQPGRSSDWHPGVWLLFDSSVTRTECSSVPGFGLAPDPRAPWAPLLQFCRPFILPSH